MYSLAGRAKTIDALLHEWKSDLLRIWIPLIAGAAMLIGLFGGIEIQGCRDSVHAVAARVAPTVVQPVQLPEPHQDHVTPSRSNKQHPSQVETAPGTEDER